MVGDSVAVASLGVIVGVADGGSVGASVGTSVTKESRQDIRLR